jgi:hypothetical protein
VKKKNTLFSLFLLFAVQLIGQQSYTHRTILKTEPVHLASGQLNVWIEKHFSRRSAIEFAGGFIFSDYTDKTLLPYFIKKEQIQRTEGYVLRTNYRRYKNKIEQTESVSRYFQIDFFVKVIDYKPVHQQNYVIYGLKDVVGLSLNWGKPKITSQFWVYDMYAGLGFRIKFYHTDRFVENQGNWVPAPAHQITNVLPFIQAGVKLGKVIGDKKAISH